MALLAMGSVGTTIQKNPIRMNMNSLRIRYFHMPLLTAKETGKDSALTQIPCYIMRQPQKILDDLGNLADENTYNWERFDRYAVYLDCTEPLTCPAFAASTDAVIL
jgi:hypothetical protein